MFPMQIKCTKKNYTLDISCWWWLHETCFPSSENRLKPVASLRTWRMYRVWKRLPFLGK